MPGAASAARPVARHCPEVFDRADRAEAPSRFADAGPDFARVLAHALGGLMGGVRLRIACSQADEVALDSLPDRPGGAAMHSLLRFAVLDVVMRVSVAIPDLLILTDRVFGGGGDLANPLPEDLPLTADLVAAELENAVAAACQAGFAPVARPESVARAKDAARLGPLGKGAVCKLFTLTVSEPDRPDWCIHFAMCSEAFSALFAAEQRRVPAVKRSADPLRAPFAEVPLPIKAVVAEFSLPVTRLSRLKIGDTIPLALSREVPLKISETTIAYGSIGAADERVAVQLTRVF